MEHTPANQELIERSDLDIRMRSVPPLLKRVTYSVAAMIIPKARTVFGNASFSVDLKSINYPVLTFSMRRSDSVLWTLGLDLPGEQRLRLMTSEDRKGLIREKIKTGLLKVEEIKNAQANRASSRSF